MAGEIIVKIKPDTKLLDKVLEKARSLSFGGSGGGAPIEEKKKNSEEKRSNKKQEDLLSKIVKSVGLIAFVGTALSGLIDLLKPFVNLFAALSALVFFPLWEKLKPFLDSFADFIGRTAKEGGGVTGVVKAAAAPTERQIELGIPENELPNIGTAIAGALIIAIGIGIAAASPFIAGATIGAAIVTALLGVIVIAAPSIADFFEEKIGKFWTVLLGLVLAGIVTTILFLMGGWILALVGLLTAAIIAFLPQLKQFGNWLWDKITGFVSSSLEVLSNIGQFIKDKILGFFGRDGSSRGGESVGDAIITPRGNIIRTDPRDFLIATKNPSDLVNNQNTVGNITFTINNPVIRNDNDIRKLADEVGRVLQRQANRGFSSQ